MNIISVLPALFLCAVAPTNYDESKAGTYTLPDPLVFNNGQRVHSATEWRKARRDEIGRLFEDNVYGHGQRGRFGLRFQAVEVDEHALGGTAIRKQVTIWFSPRKDGPKEDLLIYLPAGARKPTPIILSLNFGGNQTVIDDPGIRLPMVWNPQTHVLQQATEQSRGSSTDYQVKQVLARGYGFATIYYQDIEPDFLGGVSHGIRPLFYKNGETEPAADDWGAIGAWAWGLSRALDYMEKDLSIDSKHVAVMGHSRLGKTALWAAALDTRFAMVLSSCSGKGGAALSRRNYGETVRNLADVFPYWFASTFQKYADHTDQLPVDQHELIALIAPRPVYVTAAEDDKWADPRGEFLACVAAGPVYRMLGAEDLGTDQMPPLNHPIQHTIAFHYRSGKHEVTAFDWDQFLSFADKHLK